MKKDGDTLPDPDLAFSSDGFLQQAADNFAKKTGIDITPGDKHILRTNRELARAAFSPNGIGAYLRSGWTSIGELNLKSPQFLNVLCNPLIHDAISRQTITVREVLSVPDGPIAAAADRLRNCPGDTREIATMLGLHGDRALAFASRLTAAVRESLSAIEGRPFDGNAPPKEEAPSIRSPRSW